jgi:nitrite reductase/ring-hydroxylating ferredoxin subunit
VGGNDPLGDRQAEAGASRGRGLVGRLPDAPGGSIVVLRIDGQLHAIRDECPHAGASLADATLEGTVITCPRYGSQFDVITGARERGPSDFPIRTYRVVSDGDATFVDVPR